VSWLEYTVKVATAGLYTFQRPIQPVGSGAVFSCENGWQRRERENDIPQGKNAKWTIHQQGEYLALLREHVMRDFSLTARRAENRRQLQLVQVHPQLEAWRHRLV